MFDTYCIIYFYVINLKDTFSIYFLIYMNVIALHVNPLLIFVIRFDYNGLRKLQQKLHTIWKIKKSTLTTFSVFFCLLLFFKKIQNKGHFSPLVHRHSHQQIQMHSFMFVWVCKQRKKEMKLNRAKQVHLK